MRPLRKLILLALGVIALLAGYFLSDLAVKMGGSPLQFSPILTVLIFFGAVVLAIFGQAVKRLRDGKPSWIQLAKAPLVALVAQASAVWSALFLGYLLSQLILAYQLRHAEMAGSFAGNTIALALVNLLLLVVALLVESWCIIDDGEDGSAGANPAPGGVNPASA
ncbi:DUF3180 family protein [Varibaculum cambriense]|uniref:DUF3180 family protein n=1 Tax=Varibaculum cambriense TaxID=184870 RepID=UPI0028FE9034|nr:DUF3180 family protein [Varibaculum cambriense]MDU1224956.1 DUF3180 family protein [Varibaculum cambriense]